MKKKSGIGEFILSVFFAPVAGLLISGFLLFRLGAYDSSGDFAEFTAACASVDGPHSFYCHYLVEAKLLQQFSLLALAGTILLPLGYTIVVWLLARNRAALAYAFPAIVRFCLLILPFLLIAHAALIGFEAYVLAETKLVRPNTITGVGTLLLIGAMLLAAINILAGIRNMLAIEPLRVTGFLVDEVRLPGVHSRVRRIAQKLGVSAPDHIVVGIEPTLFMAAMPVRLRGQGDVPQGTTLYVSTLALQLLDDAELDALLAHELAHFRGPDLVFSQRFAPARAGLENAADSVSDDDESESAFVRLAKMPAFGLLAFMLWVLKRRLVSANVDRELLADRAALEVSTAPQLISMVIKITALSAQWAAFRDGLASLMNRGVGRRNIAQDYLARTRAFIALTDQRQLHANLSRMSAPHPLDNHLQLESRAYALQLDEKTMIATSLLALTKERDADPVLTAIESEITAADLDYTRVPGHPIAISEESQLPPELAHP